MNRKEKEQNTDVSKQICVHKTQNTLLEFNSFLRMAEPKDFWHLHEDFASDYSRIRAVMVDYSKEDSISVYANLSPEIIKYLYSRIWNNVQEFKFFQQKIFCEDKNSNMGRVTVFSIQRKVRNNKGEVLNYPWVVRIQNGTGVAMHNANGGQYCKKDSYRKEKEVTIQLKDEEIFTLFARTSAVIRAFEQDCMTRRRQAGNFQNLYRMVEKLIVGTEEEKDNAA